ncbi:hypothetical protein lbkm_1180 [Lachnospiraceae bacterium KM106-2]|nr:hypothetical protein lbkm_1180 [Lachnospiraceae bacterium KM106-2]
MFKKKKVKVILLIAILLIGIRIATMTPYTKVGAIRYECLKNGNYLSAFFLVAKEEPKLKEGDTDVYMITFCVPYERATDAHLDQWNVTKKKNGTYEAHYGVG